MQQGNLIIQVNLKIVNFKKLLKQDEDTGNEFYISYI